VQQSCVHVWPAEAERASSCVHVWTAEAERASSCVRVWPAEAEKASSCVHVWTAEAERASSQTGAHRYSRCSRWIRYGRCRWDGWQVTFNVMNVLIQPLKFI